MKEGFKEKGIKVDHKIMEKVVCGDVVRGMNDRVQTIILTYAPYPDEQQTGGSVGSASISGRQGVVCSNKNLKQDLSPTYIKMEEVLRLPSRDLDHFKGQKVISSWYDNQIKIFGGKCKTKGHPEATWNKDKRFLFPRNLWVKGYQEHGISDFR